VKAEDLIAYGFESEFIGRLPVTAAFEKLEVEDLFPASYVLEVSSPGLDRKLVKPSDFVHFAGRRARVVLREPAGEQKVFEGRLAGMEAGRVRLDLGERGVTEFELSNISKARLVVEP
jgi:ribosome maturation factor RimP